MRLSLLPAAALLAAASPALVAAQAPVDALLTPVPTPARVEALAPVVQETAPLSLPAETFAQPVRLPRPAINRFGRWMVQDAGAFARDLAPRAPGVVIGSAALLAAGMQVDAPMLNGVQIAYAGRILPPLDAANELGGPKAMPLAGLAFGATLLTRNDKLQDAAFTSFQSVLYAGAISYGLKAATGRIRPEDVQDARLMRPFSGHTSFPSGHTTQAFAIITPWMYYYPGPVTYGLVAVAGGTAIARVARNKHWPTDIAAGAALGFTMGRYLARRHLRERGRAADAPRLRVDPIASTQEIGASLTLRLD
jgi:membrane-associated phospholipid phosphatase